MDEHHNPRKSELKFLERLSMEQLEALLKYSGDPDDMELLFDTVVEEVVAREREKPTGRLPGVDAAWDEFQMMYQNMPDGEMLPPLSTEEAVSVSAGENGSVPLATSAADTSRRIFFLKVFHIAAVMAAAVVLSLALMVGVQAAGVDVFGALARWTDDTFHFETRSTEQTYCEALHNSIQNTLDSQGVSSDYIPTWFPAGFDVASTNIIQDSLGVSIQIMLVDDRGNSFSIGIDRYKESTYIDPQIFEIEADSVEEYPSNSKTYYIFSNEDAVTAAWSNGSILQRIWGDLTVQEIKSIINSIGGK